MARLTDHFSVEELTHTDTGLSNDAPLAVGGNLLRLCRLVLEPAREMVGPLRINSGFRSPAVNKAVGGVATSAHLDGRAADVVPTRVSISVLFDLVRDSDIPFDQCILEPTWVHLAIARVREKPRREVLRAHMANGHMVYERVK